LIKTLDLPHLAARIHHDQNIRGNPPDAAGLVQNVVFGDNEIGFFNVGDEFAIFVKGDDVNLYFLCQNAHGIIFPVWCRRRLHATALGIRRENEREKRQRNEEQEFES